MFILKVFLIFSYSSVFDKIRHRRQRFLSAGSPAAVWCVVVWSRLTYVLGFIQNLWKLKKKKKSHELLNRTTVGLYMKVLFKGSLSAMLTLVFFLFLFLRLCHCICFTVKLDLITWSLRVSENSRSKVPIKANPLPGPSTSRPNSTRMLFILSLWFSPGE